MSPVGRLSEQCLSPVDFFYGEDIILWHRRRAPTGLWPFIRLMTSSFLGT